MAIIITDEPELNEIELEALEVARSAHATMIEENVEEEASFWRGVEPVIDEPCQEQLNQSITAHQEQIFPVSGKLPSNRVLDYFPLLETYYLNAKPVNPGIFMGPPFDHGYAMQKPHLANWKVITQSPCTPQQCDGRFSFDKNNGKAMLEVIADASSSFDNSNTLSVTLEKKFKTVFQQIPPVSYSLTAFPVGTGTFKWNLPPGAACTIYINAFMSVSEPLTNDLMDPTKKRKLHGIANMIIDRVDRSTFSSNPSGTKTVSYPNTTQLLPKVDFTPVAGKWYLFQLTFHITASVTKGGKVSAKLDGYTSSVA